ncbi:hypothetical protein AB0J35_57780 [Nonomuraea angiospora]|uniref:hypothetical protein n=1 Tax=Nonomuraea angiospora TaxID=46172 RepID=UPI00342C162D
MVARAYQIPRSRLLGREPRSVTRFEYDDGGRLVRAITVRESEWLEEDRDAALAELLEERARCPGPCGLPLDTTVGQANDGKFVAPPPYQCHACEAIIARQKEWIGPDAADKIFHVRRRD